MTQEEKELLLVDLCARLPYGMKAQVCERNDEDGSYFYNNCEILGIKSNSLVEFIRIDDSGKKYGRSDWFNISWFKPYLRPMSSMTAEELHEVQEILGEGVEIHEGFIQIVYSSINSFTYLELQAVFNWLNKHMFDYRGLIPMGLALEAKEGMYGT